MTLLPAWLRWVLPLIALAVLGFLSAYLYSPGALAITPSDVLAALKAPNSTDLSIPQMLVVETRLPRIVVALLCGAVLAVSGLLLQTMTRNPLASPSLLSINAGAGLGVILAGVFMTGAGALTQSTAAAIGGGVAQAHVGMLRIDVDRAIEVAFGAGFHQFAVKVDDVRAAGAFVEVIHVLRDNANVKVALQGRQSAVAVVGLGAKQFASAGVVEVEDKLRIAGEALGRGDIFDAIILPQPVGVAEGGDAALGAHAGAGEDD